ncbi:MAG TPA: acyloxyacyl hydrolase [Gallionellaceae bacterium]
MRKLLVLVLFMLAAPCARAVDGVYIEGGEGNNVDMLRIGAFWKWDKTWMYGDNWQITGAWEVAAGGLRGDKPNDNNQDISDIGITPVFHMMRVKGTGITPYVEGGFLGLHLISRAYAYNDRKFGSGFQFGHHLGFGVNFGERREYTLGYRLHHMSNGGIVQPNQGVNLNEIHFAYSF